MRPDHVAGCRPDRRVGRGEDEFVNSSAARGARASVATGFTTPLGARAGVGPGAAPRSARARARRAAPRPPAAPARACPRCARAAGRAARRRATRDPQVADHEVHRVPAELRHRGRVLGAARQQHAEARLGHELLERLRACETPPARTVRRTWASGPGVLAFGHAPSPPAPERPRPSLRAWPSPPGRGASRRRRAPGPSAISLPSTNHL